MRKYFLLQCKRFFRLLPGMLLVLAALGLILGLVLGSLLDDHSQQDEKLSIALVGTSDDPILSVGLTALQTIDDSRYTVELLAMTEAEARDALSRGDVSAYVVIPEGFMEEALHGRFMPIRYVGTADADGVVSLFKTEFTTMISHILTEARKGVYGFADAMDGAPGTRDLMNQMALKYVEFVLVRGQTYLVEELGIADKLGLEGYLLCGLTVLLLGLMCLPFSATLIYKDSSLRQLLRARGIGTCKQILCEYGAFFAGLLVLTAAVVLALGMLPHNFTGLTWLRLIPAVFMLSAMSYLLCQLSRELISGVVLQFFLFVSMAFVSGCLYPVFFFPESIQKLAALLPTGLARMWLAAGITGKPGSSMWLWVIGGGALTVSAILRSIQLRNAGR